MQDILVFLEDTAENARYLSYFLEDTAENARYLSYFWKILLKMQDILVIFGRYC